MPVAVRLDRPSREGADIPQPCPTRCVCAFSKAVRWDLVTAHATPRNVRAAFRRQPDTATVLPIIEPCSRRSACTRATPRRDTLRPRRLPSAETKWSSESSSLRYTGCTMVQSSPEPRSTPSWIGGIGDLRGDQQGEQQPVGQAEQVPRLADSIRGLHDDAADAGTPRGRDDRHGPARTYVGRGVPSTAYAHPQRGLGDAEGDDDGVVTGHHPIEQVGVRGVAVHRVEPARGESVEAWRAKAVTWWPRSSRASQTARPDPPVAPITRMSIRCSDPEKGTPVQRSSTLAGSRWMIYRQTYRNLDRSSRRSR